MFSLIVGSQLPNTESTSCVRLAMAHYVHRDIRHAEKEAKFVMSQGDGPAYVSARQCELRGDLAACAAAIVEEEAQKVAIAQGGTNKRYKTGQKRRKCMLSDCKTRKRRKQRRALINLEL